MNDLEYAQVAYLEELADSLLNQSEKGAELVYRRIGVVLRQINNYANPIDQKRFWRIFSQHRYPIPKRRKLIVSLSAVEFEKRAGRVTDSLHNYNGDHVECQQHCEAIALTCKQMRAEGDVEKARSMIKVVVDNTTP